MTDEQFNALHAEITALCASLIPDIRDDYRATTDDPYDDVPGMTVTVGADESGAWSYQTGDNSYTGGAYGFPAWGVGYLFRDSDPAAVAENIVDEITAVYLSTIYKLKQLS